MLVYQRVTWFRSIFLLPLIIINSHSQAGLTTTQPLWNHDEIKPRLNHYQTMIHHNQTMITNY